MDSGSRIGHYIIVQKLGSGGMGDVYLATDATLQRQVALKFLPPDVAANPDRRARFDSEARAIAALNHPNIVTIYSIERDGDAHFIVMEYVCGRTLTAIVPPKGLPLPEFFAIALPLVEAVSAAHQQHVTHRDLKPDNVMITEQGRVKVLDFGLAKMKRGFADDASATEFASPFVRTLAGQVLGTIEYMSPEQAEARSVDERSDIFSLGIILHEMLTGTRPFGGTSSASTLSAILRDEAPPVTARRPDVPPALAAIVQRCLEKSPAARYQHAESLSDALAAVAAERVPTAAKPPQARSTGRSAALLTAATLVIAAGAYWTATRPPRTAAVHPWRDPEFTQLTHAAGQELFPSLAPDGRTFAFVAAGDGNLDIYSQRAGGDNAMNLTRDSRADDSQPAFSPDGERIVFRSERDGGGLFVMGATGESVRRVSDAGYHPSWSPDGRFVVCSTHAVANPAFRFSASQLYVVDAATGEKRLVTGTGDAIQPSWSPDGQRIAYWGRSTSSGTGDIFTVTAAGGPPVAVVTDAAMDWNPVWSPDGAHIYFSSDRSGTMNLWRVAIDARTGSAASRPQAVTTGVGAVSQHLTFSQDGTRLAYVSRTDIMNLQKIAFDPVQGVVRGAAEWVTRGSRSAAQPEPSPDGTLIAFSSAGKQEDIFVAHADGSSLQQLTDDAFKDRAARWSPDGQRIAFYSDRSGAYELWSIRRDGSGLAQLTRSPGAHYPVWSPDGRRMAFSTHAPNGAGIFEIGKPWPSQGARMLPPLPDATHSFEAWSWSPDGSTLAGQRHLADLSHAGIGVHRIGSTRIEWLTDFGEWPIWLQDGRRMLFSDNGRLFVLERATGQHREVLSLPQQTLGTIGLSSDNRTIYFTYLDAESDVWLMTRK